MNDKQKKMAMKWESDLSVTCMIKNRIGQHEVLLPINQNCYNFWKKKNIEQTSLVEIMSWVKDSSTLEISIFLFLRDTRLMLLLSDYNCTER